MRINISKLKKEIIIKFNKIESISNNFINSFINNDK